MLDNKNRRALVAFLVIPITVIPLMALAEMFTTSLVVMWALLAFYLMTYEVIFIPWILWHRWPWGMKWRWQK